MFNSNIIKRLETFTVNLLLYVTISSTVDDSPLCPYNIRVGFARFTGIKRHYIYTHLPKFAGSNPAEAVGFFRTKKSSARLTSEGK